MPKKKITDEALDAGPAEQVADESLADEAAPETPEPESFDVAEWLQNIGPVRVAYPLAGGHSIPMCSRTPDWLREFGAEFKDMEKAEQDRAFVAAHIDGDISPDLLTGLQEHRPTDFLDMLSLAIQIDTRPSNQIQPRFLRGASD